MLVSLAHVSAIDSHQPLCNDFDAEIASLGDGLALQVDVPQPAATERSRGNEWWR